MVLLGWTIRFEILGKVNGPCYSLDHIDENRFSSVTGGAPSLNTLQAA